MNRINLNIAVVAAVSILLAGCSKNAGIDLNIPNADSYSKLYMPQALDNPKEISVNITNEDYDVSYSAFLGGPSSAKKEIPVNFSVLPELVASYNMEHNTAYEIMPSASYSLTGSAVISEKSQSTGALKLILKTQGFIKPFETYLLPVVLTQPGETFKLTEGLNVTYFLFTGSYPSGEVPREKVLSLGATAGSFIIDFNGDIIYKEPSAGDLLLYTVNPSNGQFTTSPRKISSGWNVMDKIFSFGGNRIIGRFGTGAGNINQYVLDQNGNFGAQREVGQGWGVLANIVPYKGLLLGVMPNGDMTMYPLNGGGDFDYGNIRQIGTGWGSFKQVFQYQNSLLAIEPNGDMWQFPLTDDGVFGTRKKVGTGWDMYTKVIIAGTDLLALDSNGDLWRYKFNPAGVWALKK